MDSQNNSPLQVMRIKGNALPNFPGTNSFCTSVAASVVRAGDVGGCVCFTRQPHMHGEGAELIRRGGSSRCLLKGTLRVTAGLFRQGDCRGQSPHLHSSRLRNAEARPSNRGFGGMRSKHRAHEHTDDEHTDIRKHGPRRSTRLGDPVGCCIRAGLPELSSLASQNVRPDRRGC